MFRLKLLLLYSAPEFQELYNTLTLDLTIPGTEFSFLADTDLIHDSSASAEIVLVRDGLIKAAEPKALNKTLRQARKEARDLKRAIQLAISEAQENGLTKEQATQDTIDAAAAAGNKVAQSIQQNENLIAAISEDPALLTDATKTKINKLPKIIENPTTPEDIAENARNEQILEIVEHLIEQNITEEWVVEGNGDIEVEIDNVTGELAISLTVADENDIDTPLVLSTLIKTPRRAFTIDFNLMFETLTGSLLVSLDNGLGDLFEVTYLAADYQSFTSVSLLIDDSNFFKLRDVELKFSLFPGSPASALIKDINVSFFQVPAPATLSLLGLFLLGLALGSHRKKA